MVKVMASIHPQMVEGTEESGWEFLETNLVLKLAMNMYPDVAGRISLVQQKSHLSHPIPFHNYQSFPYSLESFQVVSLAT